MIKACDIVETCLHVFLFICVVTGLILLRFLLLEPIDEANRPNMSEIIAFSETLSANGLVIVEGSALYNASLILWSKTTKKPLIIVQPKTDEDVVKSLAWVKLYSNFPFSVKGGGHSAAFYCLNDGGFVLDMSKHYTQITWGTDGTSVTLQAGLTWGHVYAYLENTTKIIVGGTCPTVGVVGWSLGGGFSLLSPGVGMGVDNLLSATLILANGTHAVASPSTNTDLYWALRGGGGGNFGIVTSITVNVYETFGVTGFTACWNTTVNKNNLIAAYLYFYDWKDTVSQDSHFYWYIVDGLWCFDIIGSPTQNVSLSDILPLVQTFYQLQPTSTSTYEYLSMYDVTKSEEKPVPNLYLYLKSTIVFKYADSLEIIESLLKLVDQPKGVDYVIVFEGMNGAITKVPSQATAFPHRNAQIDGIIQVKVFWNDEAFEAECVEWVTKVVNVYQNYTTGSYVNYIDPLLENWQWLYYKENYGRLKEIKKSVDPGRFFDFPQAI